MSLTPESIRMYADAKRAADAAQAGKDAEYMAKVRPRLLDYARQKAAEEIGESMGTKKTCAYIFINTSYLPKPPKSLLFSKREEPRYHNHVDRAVQRAVCLEVAAECEKLGFTATCCSANCGDSAYCGDSEVLHVEGIQ
jgi:hypothetical protein